MDLFIPTTVRPTGRSSDYFENVTELLISDTPMSNTTDTILFIAVSVGMVVTVAGNSLVLGAFLTDSRVREKPSNFYICNLSLSDLLVGISVMPIFLFSKGFPDSRLPGWVSFCSWWMLVPFFLLVSSFHSILLITYDRLNLVRDPFRYITQHTRKTACIRLATSWVLSVVAMTVYSVAMFLYPVKPEIENNACGVLRFTFFKHPYLKYLSLLEPSILTVLLTGMNLGIIRYLYQGTKTLAAWDSSCHHPTITSQNDQSSSRNSFDVIEIPVGTRNHGTTQTGKFDTPIRDTPPSSNNNSHSVIRHLRKNKKAIQKSLLIVAAYRICFYPWFTVSMLEAFSVHVEFNLIESANVLMWLNSMVNPFLYATTNVRLRRGMSNLVRKINPLGNQ